MTIAFTRTSHEQLFRMLCICNSISITHEVTNLFFLLFCNYWEYVWQVPALLHYVMRRISIHYAFFYSKANQSEKGKNNKENEFIRMINMIETKAHAENEQDKEIQWKSENLRRIAWLRQYCPLSVKLGLG